LNALPFVRLLLDLPRRRNRATADTTWVPMPDGVRLATTVYRPVGAERAPTVLLRTPYGSRQWRTPMFLLGQAFAEAGMTAVLQDVRGRYDSEGAFTPFVNEAADGGATIDWVREQPWFGGRLGLAGFSYLGYAAWAAQGARPDAVDAVAVGIGTSDLYASFYPGGAFALETALRWAAGVGERENLPERNVDLERAMPFRPIREADRVAARERSFYRDWVDHPRRDDYWNGFHPQLAKTPPTLLLAGWYDFFLGPQLGDYAALLANPDAGPVRLVVGPWTHGQYVKRRRSPRSRWFARTAVREMLAFFERHLLEQSDVDASAGAHILALGEETWRDYPSWPPPGVEPLHLHLHSGGNAAGPAGDGRLGAEDPAADEPADTFTADPNDPVPTLGGALIGPGGAVDQRAAEARSDVLLDTGEPRPDDRHQAGPVRCELTVESSAPDADFTAKLVDVAPDGLAVNLAEGVVRARWREGGMEPGWLESGVPVRISIDLWSVAARIRAGHRLRLEIAASNFPRFDRNPNSRDEPAATDTGLAAQQTVHHRAEHPSTLTLTTLRLS
jgi:putative CocE/NonD family hydrolase